jgi:hypothetical protein
VEEENYKRKESLFLPTCSKDRKKIFKFILYNNTGSSKLYAKENYLCLHNLKRQIKRKKHGI